MRLRKTIFRFAKRLIYWRNLLIYQLRGRKPWGRGYFEHKWTVIRQCIHDKDVMTSFQHGTTLPSSFGTRIDERIVEYSWLLSHMHDGAAVLLDAGSALNFEAILAHPRLSQKKITIATLHPEANCFWNKGVSYLFGDIRSMPFVSETFDIITCISTLEHVGMDNTKIYTSDAAFRENKTEDYLVAVAEFKRLLKPGGTLFITVPFGIYHHFGFFQQFNREMVRKVTKIFGEDKSMLTFYKYENNGWNISTEEKCNSAEYITADRAKVSSTLPAAASAIVCMKLTK